MNRNAASARAERYPPMTLEPSPLTDAEIQLLIRLIEDSRNPTARDLLAFAGANSAAGLLTRLAALDAHDRRVLITAIRVAIGQV